MTFRAGTYDLIPVGTVVKLQMFCKVARHAGPVGRAATHAASSRTTMLRAWRARKQHLKHARTAQEFVAPKVVLFYQADWTPYLDDRSRNHESVSIMKESEDATGINASALVDFHPGTRDAREKLRWASTRVTTLQEDIAYSLFGIFSIHLPVIYGEKRRNTLGRLLQEIIAHSGDIAALDWLGQSSNFNNEMQMSVSMLQNSIVAVEWALRLYTLLENPSVPQFADARLQLPWIAFPLTEVLVETVTTEDSLVQFLPARHTRQSFLLVHARNRDDLGLINFADETQSVEDWPESKSPGYNEPTTRELRLIVRLGQPFGRLLLAQQWGREYKRIASDNNIIAQVKDMTCVDNMMDLRMLEILFQNFLSKLEVPLEALVDCSKEKPQDRMDFGEQLHDMYPKVIFTSGIIYSQLSPN
ncbi:uncharacterized protein F5891DRAFT_985470 [Suillus fuscotomentosus]|uniref:Uncharacterized protein n=1 Tax=Suillus fuscotomentosus TaxID=1912939 RepID=A0AAD4HFQ9_9AGAM|nr:uncharacterized protein F5891DRAFT_985470 [Suillus fuscotomentosus]KAG1893834.1 hypothetical protein F5891DRAFT_985470 [Suillus fuscotomentosus]